eukprot:242440_1
MVTFVDTDAASNFECIICLDLFKEPVQIGCNDHIFCRRCITGMIQSPMNTFKCPMCRVRCKASSIRRVQFIDRQINQLLVQCPNHTISTKKAQYLATKSTKNILPPIRRRSARLQKKTQEEEGDDDIVILNSNTNNKLCGKKRKRSFDETNTNNSNKKHKQNDHELCDWIGALSSLKTHTKTCPLHLISCEFCSNPMLQRDLKQHKATCDAVPIQCVHCKETGIVRRDMSSHIKNTCPRTRIPCSQCGKNIPRRCKRRHKRYVCPETEIKCEFHSFGCLDVFKRKDQDKHRQDSKCTHKHLVGLSRKVEVLTTQNATLMKRINALERNQRNQRKDINRLDSLEQRRRNRRVSISSVSTSSLSDPSSMDSSSSSE